MILATDPDLSQILARAITMPFTHSFPPTRWRTTVQFVLATLKGMHSLIQTAHDIYPSSFYTSTVVALILGVLQGSGAAPCIWLSLSCILLHALHPHTTGFQASSPRNNCTSPRSGETFVDDTNLWLTGTYPFTPPSTLVSTMQRVAQVWECLLSASSGALAL